MSTNLYRELARRYDPAFPSAVSRRQLLRGTLAAGAGLLLSGLVGGRRATAAPRAAGARRVIVIGAGLAGLACAYELTALGYDVQVFDGRRRLGGRVLTITDFVPGRVIEGGGEFIGSNHPHWVQYAARFGLQFLDVGAEPDLSSPIVINGRRLSDSEAERLYVEMGTALQSLNADAERVDAEEPWKTPDAPALDARSMAEWLADQNIPQTAKKAIEIQLVSTNGVALEHQSYLGMLALIKGGGLSRFWTETEAYRCLGGNALLAQRLADGIGRERIALETPIIRVIISRGKAAAVTAAGDRFEADELVVTVPPSAWRNIEFFPDLPAPLRPQMGSNVKVLAGLGRRFWLDSRTSPSGMSDGEVMMTWEATEGQGGEGGACLTGFSGGPMSEALRLRSDADRQRDALLGMQGMYPDITREQVRMRFLDWPSDRWAGGSYSFPAPGQVTTIGPALAAPRGTPPIMHFAGEHCCPKFAGYMEGALDSGVRIARRIASRDGLAPAMPSEPMRGVDRPRPPAEAMPGVR